VSGRPGHSSSGGKQNNNQLLNSLKERHVWGDNKR